MKISEGRGFRFRLVLARVGLLARSISGIIGPPLFGAVRPGGSLLRDLVAEIAHARNVIDTVPASWERLTSSLILA